MGCRRIADKWDSFPLYAKGVEKYRYDYAVFLLNKNIELVGRRVVSVLEEILIGCALLVDG